MSPTPLVKAVRTVIANLSPNSRITGYLVRLARIGTTGPVLVSNLKGHSRIFFFVTNVALDQLE